uniref:PP1-binding domain-containing protein n=1 Tax=Cyanistes caeruleus TaxID=156563 RepID=A0A8C0UEK5_CYACU
VPFSGTSPTSLKFRRRSTVGLRGSPENNTLIRYLAQQRSNRQKEAFTQVRILPKYMRGNFHSLQKPPCAGRMGGKSWEESSSRDNCSVLLIVWVMVFRRIFQSLTKPLLCANPPSLSCLFHFIPTERTDSQSSKTPKKKKVTFGEVLSPEIFDQSLPANTPLRRGASPGCPQGQSLRDHTEKLIPFDSHACWTLGFYKQQVPPSTPNPIPQQCRAVADDTDCSSLGATNPGNDKDTKNPGRSKIQRQENPTKKTKYPSFGRRRKKKVKKSLYGEREMASKKPLLSPIPEIPEVFSSLSSPSSPKAAALFTGNLGFSFVLLCSFCSFISTQEHTQKYFFLLLIASVIPQAGRRSEKLRAAAVCPVCPGLLEEAAASSSGPGDSEVPGSLEAAPGPAPEVTAGLRRDHRSDLWGKNTRSDQTGDQAAMESPSLGIQNSEAAQRTKCPQKDSVRGDSARRRRSSSRAFFFPPAENLEIIGADLPVSSYNVEEFFSVPQAKEGSLQACRRSSASAEVRVRRSMRLSKDAASEGLAWIQLPSEIPKPSLPAAPKARRRFSTSILAGSENIHPREQTLLPLPAPGKENEGSVPLAAGPGRRWRRRSLFEATAQEMPWAPTQRRRSTNSGSESSTALWPINHVLKCHISMS